MAAVLIFDMIVPEKIRSYVTCDQYKTGINMDAYGYNELLEIQKIIDTFNHSFLCCERVFRWQKSDKEKNLKTSDNQRGQIFMRQYYLQISGVIDTYVKWTNINDLCFTFKI